MKKRILLISSDFFKYYELISKELENQGWDVTYMNDRPSANSFMKIFIRKFRFLMTWYLDAFYLKKIKNSGVFDHVLIVKGEGITPKLIQHIRQHHSRGKIFLYLWDGIKNSTGALQNAAVVDQTFTFDPKDSEQYRFPLLPLFYVESVNKSIEQTIPAQWDISFVGSVHGDRLKVINRIRKNSVAGTRFFVFVYFPSKLLFYFRRFLDNSFSSFAPGELCLKTLPKQQAQAVFNSSRAVLDVHHMNQTGLTMRTLEVLSLGKKLVTTNETIKKYPFYKENCIWIIDRNNPQVDPAFFASEVPADYALLLKPYELAQWVKTLTKI